MHLQKVTRVQATQIAEEIERTSDYMSHYDHNAHSIDASKTKLNYDLVKSDQRITERLDARLRAVKCMKRADIKPLGQWAITAPKDLDPNLRPLFFKTVYDYLCQTYGKENVIYAMVHRDETMDHMHAGVVPVAKNSKGIERVSAKEVFNKVHLQSFHADMQAYCEERLGCEVNLLNGESLGVDGIRAYKQAKEVAKSIAVLEEQEAQLKAEVRELTLTRNALREEVEELEPVAKEKKSFIKSVIDYFGTQNSFFLSILNWLQHKGFMKRLDEEQNLKLREMFKQDLERARDNDYDLSR